jgi:hypothetical protein
MAAAATRSKGQLGKALQLGQGQIGVALTGETEAAVAEEPELGVEAVIGPEPIEGVGRAQQFLVGGRDARPGAVEIGQQSPLAIGDADAPDRCLTAHRGQEPLLQRRAAHLKLQLGQAHRRGQRRQRGQRCRLQCVGGDRRGLLGQGCWSYWNDRPTCF